jgi:hypothetical protein
MVIKRLQALKFVTRKKVLFFALLTACSSLGTGCGHEHDHKDHKHHSHSSHGEVKQ